MHIRIQRGQLPPYLLKSREGTLDQKPKKMLTKFNGKTIQTRTKNMYRTGFEPVSRYQHALKPLSYMRIILVLFCLARYHYFIIQS